MITQPREPLIWGVFPVLAAEAPQIRGSRACHPPAALQHRTGQDDGRDHRPRPRALRRRIASIVAAAAKRIDGLQGPVHKRIGDAMAEQIGHLAEAISLEIYIPERDLVVVNRPEDP